MTLTRSRSIACLAGVTFLATSALAQTPGPTTPASPPADPATAPATAPTPTPSPTPSPTGTPTPTPSGTPTPSPTPSPSADPVPPGYVVIEGSPAAPSLAPALTPAPDKPAVPPPPPRRRRFSPSIEGGYSFQDTASLPVNGFDFFGVLAGDTTDPHSSFRAGGAVGAAFGKTEGGVNVTTTSLGALLEWHYERLRLGGGLRIGTFNYGRITDRANVFNFSAGAYTHVSIDMVKFDPNGNGALFIAGRGSIDSTGIALFGLNVSLGARF